MKEPILLQPRVEGHIPKFSKMNPKASLCFTGRLRWLVRRIVSVELPPPPHTHTQMHTRTHTHSQLIYMLLLTVRSGTSWNVSPLSSLSPTAQFFFWHHWRHFSGVSIFTSSLFHKVLSSVFHDFILENNPITMTFLHDCSKVGYFLWNQLIWNKIHWTLSKVLSLLKFRFFIV